MAPFNSHVRCLSDKLPDAVQVGTVDKFQGQESVVIFYSMASSSGEDAPRGLEFLFSRNRLNVAISRARCRAYLVCSPRLLEVNCRSVEQMRLANALCRFVELAQRQGRIVTPAAGCLELGFKCCAVSRAAARSSAIAGDAVFSRCSHAAKKGSMIA